jgi:hypothetical protein
MIWLKDLDIHKMIKQNAKEFLKKQKGKISYNSGRFNLPLISLHSKDCI